MIARTEAAGAEQLLPAVLAFTSSLPLDAQLLKEDLLGSLAHVLMLGRQGILRPPETQALHRALVQLWREAERGAWSARGEEDVHMAVEAELQRRLGPVAGLLHTARSRNDQVSLDLHLHVRGQCRAALESLSALLERLCQMAEQHEGTLLPGYTHRQRAQPISLAYWLCGFGAMFSRDAQAFEYCLKTADLLPLGVGALAGTSLPIDREETRRLLRFSGLTDNGLDTVGDRDFALDFSYAAARCALHMSRMATDLIDFSSSEFGFVRLGGGISCGSSMMPQKRNPDLFELIRGKSGPAVGALVSLLVTLKGLPGGYNRDLQEDRRPLLEAGPQLTAMLGALRLGLENIEFDRERCLAALSSGEAQATDLAEALVSQGVPFREAYQAVGGLVSRCQQAGLTLSQATADLARAAHPGLTAEVLSRATPQQSVARKVNVGGTGPASVRRQLEALRQRAAAVRALADSIPRVDALFAQLSGEP